MPRVILDVKTEGLDELIMNLDNLTETMTLGVKVAMKTWHVKDYLPFLKRVIATGQPRSMIPPNRGLYAVIKGTTRPLGKGILYNAVISAPMTIKETRGKEVRYAVNYKEPFYLPFVHGGFVAKGFVPEGHPNQIVPERPFVRVARNKKLPVLTDRLRRLLSGVKLTDPLPMVRSTVIATNSR